MTGEIKKSIFTILNYTLPRQGARRSEGIHCQVTQVIDSVTSERSPAAPPLPATPLTLQLAQEILGTD
jgi:hypothetical protein